MSSTFRLSNSRNQPQRESKMNAETDAKAAGKCPFSGSHGPSNRHWWPKQLDVQVLHPKSKLSDPMGE